MTEQSTTELTLEERVATLEQEVSFLKGGRPGRQMKAIKVSKAGVCGVNPECEDSSKCEDASIYRYQKGCKGEACVTINREYYAKYRKDNKNSQPPTGEVTVEDAS